MTDSLIFRYIEWCMGHRVPKLVAVIPLIVGFLSPVSFMLWLGWLGAPIAAVGLAGNRMLIDYAHRSIKAMT